MSKETTPPNEATATVRNMPVTIHAQYIKDASFENPNAPHSLKATAGKPGLKLSVNLGLQDVKDDNLPGLFEVSLRLRATATRDDKTAFIAEVEYAAAVTIGKEVPENAHHPLLMIEIPKLLFPYARQVISDMSQQGGYPALLVTPIDFQELYLQKFGADLKEDEKKKARAN